MSHSRHKGVWMPVCTIRVPEGADGSPARRRPILFVKYHELVTSYATYIDGKYRFETTEDVCSSIDDGRVRVSFQFDDRLTPVAIVLTDRLEEASTIKRGSHVRGPAHDHASLNSGSEQVHFAPKDPQS